MRLDEAATSAEKLKNVTLQAAEKLVISRADAAEIHNKADSVQKAAKNGDQVTAIKKLEELHEKLDEVVAAKKGPEVAENLKKHEENKCKSVFFSKYFLSNELLNHYTVNRKLNIFKTNQ